MTDQFPGGSSSLIARVQNILLRPKTEWEVIKAEPASVQSLFTGYAMILAAIPAVAALIGGLVFGYGGFGITWRPSVPGAIVQAILTYVLSLAGVFILGLVIEALATQFGGTKDRISAMKLAVYSMTAAWLAGVFGIIPALAVLSIVGLYSLYLLYLGLPKLMNSPEDKTLVYFIVALVAAIIIQLLVGWIAQQLVGTFGFGPSINDVGNLNITVAS